MSPASEPSAFAYWSQLSSELSSLGSSELIGEPSGVLAGTLVLYPPPGDPPSGS